MAAGIMIPKVEVTNLSTKPPFLFRAASADGSRGLNTVDIIDPLSGYHLKYHPGLASIKYPQAKKMLHHHIKWDYKTPSEFSSWTFSLLYAIAHAVRKAEYYDETNVLVYVMDTRTLPASRIHNASQVLRQFKLQWEPNLTTWTTNSDEYLIHGKLENKGGLWKAVSIDELVTAGLYRVFPTLQSQELLDRLYLRVLMLRKVYFSIEYNIEVDYIYPDLELAWCFGDDFEGIVAIALVAMRRRSLDPESVQAMLDAFADADMVVPQLPWDTDPDLRTFHRVVQTLDEGKQFLQLLRLLHERQAALRAVDSETESETESQFKGLQERGKSGVQEKTEPKRSLQVQRWQFIGPRRPLNVSGLQA